VADAIEAAGGVLPDTDMSSVNLARKLTDGELIAIGVDAGATPGGKVNLNTATLAQLDGLPGVGPVLAQRIIDFRTAARWVQGRRRATAGRRHRRGDLARLKNW
jgi:competence protein ComEA